MESAFTLFLESLRKAIYNALFEVEPSFVESTSKLVLTKKIKNFFQGDIVVPYGCLKLNLTQQEQLLTAMKHYCALADSLTTSVSSDKYSLLAFHINRPKMSSCILTEIASRGTRYGYADSCKNSVVSLHTITLNKASSLMRMRLAVVKHHAGKLLEANGYTVVSSGSETDELSQLVQNISEGTPRPENSEQSSSSTYLDHRKPSYQIHLSKLQSLVFDKDVKPNTNSVSESPKLSQTSAIDKSVSVVAVCEDVENIYLDLQGVIVRKNLYQGKDGYDINLKNVQVFQAQKRTQVLEESLRILDSIPSSDQTKHHCLHVAHHRAAYADQQVILIADLLAEQNLSQSQMVIGPVTIQELSNSTPLSAEDFYTSRFSQFKEASELRTGGTTEGCPDDHVKTLTDASIKIDILGTACSSPLTLDNKAGGRGAETRLGAFILYNTGRLSTLLHRFDQAICEGIYPPLPPVDDIDCALLREEEDWELVYVYLAAFPEVVRQSVESVCPPEGKLAAKIHTHKVTNFLVSFCKSLSAHYSRYHILTGQEAHLLPLMFARLHMMKAAHQVLLNGLHLIGVTALAYV